MFFFCFDSIKNLICFGGNSRLTLFFPLLSLPYLALRIYSNTDLDRIFQVCVVVDGRASDSELIKELNRIDSGASPHWHGLRADVHSPEESDQEDKAAHGTRIHVLFNDEVRGIAESRADGVEFIHVLASKHESTGLKSPQEDLILLLLQSGVEFNNKDWLEPVTGALIVPPPLIETKDDTNNNIDSVSSQFSNNSAMKLANAVAFNIEGQGKRTSFDSSMSPIISDATGTDINLSGGLSYPTPVWNGAALAMRLDTYRNLPAQDVTLQDPWAANLELSLNLWLCADGIDMIKDLEISTSESMPRTPLAPEMAARFAAAWMDDVTLPQFYHLYSKSFPELTNLEWETLKSKARGSEYFPIDLKERCRSFSWYVHQINTDITDELTKVEHQLKREAFMEQQRQEINERKEKEEDKKKRIELEKGAALKEAAKKEAEKAALEENEEAKKIPDKPLPPPVLEGGEEKPAAGKVDEAKPDDKKEGGGEPDANKPNQDANVGGDEKSGAGKDAKPDTGEAAAAAAAAGAAKETGEAAKPDADKDTAVKRRMEDAETGDSQGRQKPSKPLRPTNLEIVQQATPIDISYVDVAGGHKEHPHKGAKDENGEWGYIHDEKSLALNPPAFGFTGKPFKDACEMRDANYMMLHNKVILDMKAHEEAEKSGKKRDKIFCLVYTIESGHPKIPAIRETWG